MTANINPSNFTESGKSWTVKKKVSRWYLLPYNFGNLRPTRYLTSSHESLENCTSEQYIFCYLYGSNHRLKDTAVAGQPEARVDEVPPTLGSHPILIHREKTHYTCSSAPSYRPCAQRGHRPAKIPQYNGSSYQRCNRSSG